jgi:hypothetical protein
MQQRVINGNEHLCARLGEVLDDQLRDPQPELIDRPLRVAEEPMRPSVMPHPRQARADEHPGDRPQPRLGNLSDDERPERPESRARETWREQEQQLVQRR